MTKSINNDVLKYTKDSIASNLTKLTKQLKSCEKLNDRKRILDQLINQKNNNNINLLLNNDTREYIFSQIESDMKTVEDKIKRIELVKKEIEFLNNLNNQVSLK